MSRTVLGFLGLVAAAAVCGCVGGRDPAAGTERGPCYGNGTCNPGLSCLSDLCVVIDAGATHRDAGTDADSGDAATVISVGACDALAQSGCDAGQACIPKVVAEDGGTSTMVETCAAAGSAAVGEECTAHGPLCVPGAMCVSNLCVRLCDTGSDTDPDSCCIPMMWSGAGSRIGAALPTCDAFAQGCAGNWPCIAAPPAVLCSPVRYATWAYKDGDSCQAATCVPGLQCVDEGFGPVCRPFCDASVGGSCRQHQVTSCTPVSTLAGGSFPHVPNNLGICTTATSL